MDSKWFRTYQGKLLNENIIPMESIVDEGDEEMSPMDKAAYGVPLDTTEGDDDFSNGFRRHADTFSLADRMRQKLAFNKESHANTMGEVMRMIEQRAHLGRDYLDVSIDSPFQHKIIGDLEAHGFTVKRLTHGDMDELHISW